MINILFSFFISVSISGRRVTRPVRTGRLAGRFHPGRPELRLGQAGRLFRYLDIIPETLCLCAFVTLCLSKHLLCLSACFACNTLFEQVLIMTEINRFS